MRGPERAPPGGPAAPFPAVDGKRVGSDQEPGPGAVQHGAVAGHGEGGGHVDRGAVRGDAIEGICQSWPPHGCEDADDEEDDEQFEGGESPGHEPRCAIRTPESSSQKPGEKPENAAICGLTPQAPERYVHTSNSLAFWAWSLPLQGS